MTLAIPALLEPLDAPGTPRPGLPDRRAMERALAEVERFLRGSGLDSIDEIKRFSGPIEPLPSTARAAPSRAIVRTRPYMRARFGLAQALEARGRREEAIAHYRELLRLNPADNQGVRFPLLAALFATGRSEEAAALLERFGDEPLATWQYGRALWAFRRQGDSPTARARRRRALRSNRHVPRLLRGERHWTGPMPNSSVPGSAEEAVICESERGEAWRGTPGAADWLAAHARRRPPGWRRR